MKKLLLIVCALLATVGAWAQAITEASQLINSKAYTITSARGAITLNTEGTAICSTKKTSGTADNDNADQSEDAQEFALYQSDGVLYIYNLKIGKFLNFNGAFSPTPTMPFTTIASNNSNYPLILASFDSKNYVNNNNQGLILINDWTNLDDGNRVAIVEKRDLTETEATAISTAVTVSPFNKNKAFTVTANRGTWCANAAGTSLATTATNTNPATGYDYFALLMFDNTLYLYNVGSQKFIKKDGSLAEGRGDAIYVRYSGDDKRPYMFYFPEGPVYFNMQNGGGRYNMNNYSTPDDGNKQSIAQVDVDPYTAATEQYNRTVSVTYNLMYEGAQVGTATATESLGVNPKVPSTIDKGLFNYTYSVQTIQSNTPTVTATATPIFTISPDYVGATWYNMYIRNDNSWIPYAATEEPYVPYAATADDKAKKELQWAFVGNPFTTGIKVINRAAGRMQSLTKDGSNAVMRDGETYWDIFGRNGGILLREHGTANNYIN